MEAAPIIVILNVILPLTVLNIVFIFFLKSDLSSCKDELRKENKDLRDQIRSLEAKAYQRELDNFKSRQ